ncbi:hypothetical protein [Alkalilacustris brevis]|uniref:hypothetical protein n=1 Tax=Alkalilacustris brevis TaxID=2026338 RepID=UPI000E0D6A2B|nr:hypothetical protein [Alkalilacustris brevis]
MKAPRQAVFVGRGTYRRRRLIDFAKLLPFLGVALIAMPVVWGPEPLATVAPDLPAAPTSDSPPQSGGEVVRDSVFLFAVWFGLVAAAFLVALNLRDAPEGEAGAPSPQEDEAP